MVASLPVAGISSTLKIAFMVAALRIVLAKPQHNEESGVATLYLDIMTLLTINP